jgi:hypothetical protein
MPEAQDCQSRVQHPRLFEPIFKTVDLFMPTALVAIQAYPNPGSLILGELSALCKQPVDFETTKGLHYSCWPGWAGRRISSGIRDRGV